MNELRNQILSLLKSGVPHEIVVEPDETRALKEIGRAAAGSLKG
jgi:hypothetical protein